jgi:hypothetical protein
MACCHRKAMSSVYAVIVHDLMTRTPFDQDYIGIDW